MGERETHVHPGRSVSALRRSGRVGSRHARRVALTEGAIAEYLAALAEARLAPRS